MIFPLFTSAGDPAVRDLNQTLPNLTPDSEKSFTRVKSWMESCHRDHPSCSSQHEQAMPKRLIAISPNNLRLLETNAEIQKYAALSYKWGGPQRVQATNASLRSLMNGFRIEDLPYSLRDAVTVTQQLGLSYLWIDALCIIQDNESDKSTEVSRMATIYENAAVTIASSRTNSAMESFLGPRIEFNGRRFDNDSSHELFGFDYHCRDGQLGSIVLMHEYMPRLFDQEPLDTRAWAFQERLLSPRIIDYCSEQTKWVCRMSQGQTGFTDGWLNRSVGYRDHELLIRSQDTIRSLDHASKNSIHNARYEWYSILSLYTSRDITRKADRLPAISAVARRYAEILEVEYMAGLWRPWLGEELLWKQHQNITGTVRPTEYQYQGPSWSWAGIDAPIEIKMLSSSERWATVTSPDSEVRRFVGIPHMDNFQSGDAFKIVDSSIKLLVTDAEFGEVKSGAQLIVHGKVRSAMLSSDWNTVKKSWLTRTRMPTTPTSQSWMSRLFDQNPSNIEILALDVYLDCAQDDFRKYGRIREFPRLPEMQVFLLSIGQYDKTHCGLILVQQTSGNYFRVGVFFSSFSRDPDDFPKDSDEQWEARKREQVLWLLSSDLQTISLV